MKYLTRYYKSLRYPDYDSLNNFTIDEQANHYSEDFYLSICKKRKAENRNIMNHLSDTEFEGYIHTDNYIGETINIFCQLPTSITSQIADVRVFLLYVISPTIYQLMKDLCEEKKTKEDGINQTLISRYELDKRKMPEHWLGLYEVYWEDGLIVCAVSDENNLELIVHDTRNMLFNIKFKNASITNSEGEFEAPVHIYFCEIFYNEPKIQLNIVTPFSEFSIEADNLIIENITPNE